MRLSSTRKHPVVDTSNAATIGKISGVVIDPSEQRIAAVVIDGSDKGSLVSWDDAAGYGPDALTVSSPDAIRLPRDDREEAAADGSLDVLGKVVYSDACDRLGKLRDLEFDPVSGAIEALVLDQDDDARLTGDRLMGVGSYAVIVRAH
jgi:sporulation protein YlmC with PRC-barrel domain